MAPTRSSFLASWRSVSDATGYRIDVSTDPSFRSYVSGYEHCDVGNVNSRIVSRLNPGTKYYYRVQPYNSAGAGANSEIATASDDHCFRTRYQSNVRQFHHGQPSVGCDPIDDQPGNRALPGAVRRFRHRRDTRSGIQTTEPDGTPITSGAIAESTLCCLWRPMGRIHFQPQGRRKDNE